MDTEETFSQELVDESSMDGPGFSCGRQPVMEEEEWLSIHQPHLGSGQEFQKAYNEVQPPSYRLYRLVCPCGQKLQCMEELEDVD